jgi:adenine-specific DNA-methyltransferase
MDQVNEILAAVEYNSLKQEEGDARAYHDRLIRCECVHMMQKLPDSIVNFVLTDPPYVARYKDRTGRQVLNDDNAEWIRPAFREVYRLLKDDSFCVSFYGWNCVELFAQAWKDCGFRPVGHLVWAKRYHSKVGFTQSCHECAFLLAKGRPQMPANPPADVLPWKYTGNKFHPTQKPVSALIPLVEAYSKPGDLILDPFGGSGSTAIAARSCNRRYLLMEADHKNFEAAKFRLVSGHRE